MPENPTFILGGYQTDFARNWLREEIGLANAMTEVVEGVLDATGVAPEEIGSGHVGNFAAELYASQGQLGAFLLEAHPALRGLPTGRHEAACASGSIAILAASAEIAAGRYDVSLVVGVEQMKTVDPQQGGDFLGTAGWYEREAKGVPFPFPSLFGRLGDAYAERYGLDDAHLTRISEINRENARRNPLAQTRLWPSNPEKEAQPLVGRIRIGDASQITDGAVGVVLASQGYAERWAAARGISLDDVPRIDGWGHRTAPMLFDEKLLESKDGEYVLPHTRQAITDAFARAGVADVWDLDAIETHDCFTTSEYMAIDHFGITAPGESWKAIEDGTIAFGGRLPVNPSGGLIGVGHPVGATGIRQLLDAYRQVSGTAGDYQVEGAPRVATLNLGGSGTTSASFIVARGE
ncbi:MAG TPA: acetyl-CoA acetyltransferase [Tepidiformaceae bacterium]|nr:acetyl-CoA acetyltransferase [Tepidiformaceae bacterium]